MDPGSIGLALGGLALALSCAAGAGMVVALTRSAPAAMRRVAMESQDTAIHLESAFDALRTTVSATLEGIEQERDAVRRERKRMQTRDKKDLDGQDPNGPPDPRDPAAYAAWLHKTRGGGILDGLG